MELEKVINYYERMIEEHHKYIPCDGCLFDKCLEEYKQLVKLLKELKAYREILANADNIIVSIYGCVIFEGYADVIDRMKEIYKKSIKNHMAESEGDNEAQD